MRYTGLGRLLHSRETCQVCIKATEQQIFTAQRNECCEGTMTVFEINPDRRCY